MATTGDRSDVHVAAFDEAAETYDAVGVPFFAVFGRHLVELVGVGPGMRVLDVGTGRGAVLLPAAEAVGPGGHVLGIDLAPEMVRRTGADAMARGLPHVRVEVGDAADPPRPPEPLDAVLSSLVLFFLPDPALALRRWASLLRPGGTLGLVTFLADPDDDVFRDVLQRHIPAPPGPTEPDDTPAEPSSFELVKDERWLDRVLLEAGLSGVDRHVLRHRTPFVDGDQLWAWVWSHGMREVLQLVPAQAHAALREDMVDALRRRNGHEDLAVHVTVRFTVARRP